jgi:hypothetical protein
MDDMNAFDRQLAAGLDRMAGPGRHIDAMAMARSADTQPPKWRDQPMFSATKFVVAGAIVALFGGFLLISQAFEQPADGVPGAAIDDGSIAPAAFTGNISEGGGPAPTSSVTDEGHTLVGLTVAGSIETTDPRMTGTWVATLNVLQVDDGLPNLATSIFEIRNDGGRWIGTNSGVQGHCGLQCSEGAAADFPTSDMIVLTGMDGYEGLTAWLVTWIGTTAGGVIGNDVVGMIVPYDMPLIPDPPTAEDWAAIP